MKAKKTLLQKYMKLETFNTIIIITFIIMFARIEEATITSLVIMGILGGLLFTINIWKTIYACNIWLKKNKESE